MSSLTLFVGLDYHQAFVQVCVMDRTGRVLTNRRCDNSAEAIVRCVEAHGEEVGAAIEACCGAAALADELIACGWEVSLAHAGYVSKIKQSPDKTDWSDARLLADLLRIGYLPRVWLPPAELRQLRHLVRHRQQLAQSKRTAKLRVTAVLRTHRVEFAVRRWTKHWIAAVRDCEAIGTQGQWVVGQLLEEIEHLQKRLVEVEARLADLTSDDAFVQKLLGYPGIGLVTAVTLKAELGTVRRFRSGKQLSRFCVESTKHLERSQASRCWTDQRWKSSAENRSDRGGPSAPKVRSPLGRAGNETAETGEAGERRGGGRGQSLGSVALSPTAGRLGSRSPKRRRERHSFEGGKAGKRTRLFVNPWRFDELEPTLGSQASARSLVDGAVGSTPRNTHMGYRVAGMLG